MKQVQYIIKKKYFQDSSYALQVSHELDNDSEGLIFDRFIHDLGAMLHLDVLYEKVVDNAEQWYIGGDQHLQVLLYDHDEEYLLSLTL
ncbi:hypothetical protein ACOI1C_08345 [Bacillus sp. DJP31]|uniref:hypothetical protein n=1 Tax=Bacillus sp. DJP31 TaxID=3409789 RepID=UPI003BB629DD